MWSNHDMYNRSPGERSLQVPRVDVGAFIMPPSPPFQENVYKVKTKKSNSEVEKEM